MIQRYRGHDLDLLMPHDVICHLTIGLLVPMCGFPLVVNMKRRCISHGVEILSCKGLAVSLSLKTNDVMLNVTSFVRLVLFC